jgi:uncharacterized protein (DUF58 family)
MSERATAARVVRSWPRPTIRGFAFLTASIVLFWAAPTLGQRELAFAAAAALSLPLLAILLVSLRRPRMTVVRRFDPELPVAGGECEVALSLQNWGPIPTPSASWSDGLPGTTRSGPTRSFPSMPAFRARETATPRTLTLRYRLATPNRGLHQVGPLRIRFSDPFGLATRQVRVGDTETLTVTPAVEALPRGSFRLASGDGQSLMSRRPQGSGDQDVIARKYQTGDSMRRVHWPATARRSELMVRQDDQNNDRDAMVVLDNRLESYQQDRRDAFEWAVSMATSIGLHLIDEGYRTRLVHTSSTSSVSAVSADVIGSATMARSELLLRGAHVRLIGRGPKLTVADIVADAGRSSGELPPLFAVLGDAAHEVIDALARASSTSSSAFAFVVHSASDTAPGWARDAGAQLERAGWSVRLVSSTESPSAAWTSTSLERAS